MSGDPHEGGCFCGRVRYRVAGEPLGSAVCHCVSCRRTSGAQSVAWLTFPHRKFSFVHGEPADYRSSDEVSRTFCQSCGTSLTYKHDEEPDSIDVTTASLDRPRRVPSDTSYMAGRQTRLGGRRRRSAPVRAGWSTGLEVLYGGEAVQTENPVYEEIQEILRAVDLPRVALVGQRIDSPPAISNIGESVREALNAVELPTGSVAIGVGSRGVARIGEVVEALVEALKDSGADPFVVPAMGSHGASTAEGQAQVLAHLGVDEEHVGCPVRATMESVRLGETPSGVAVYMDSNAYEADSVIVVNRIKPHTAFRGTVESGPTKMLAIGLGKQRGAHSIHSAGWENIHQTIPEAARVAVESGKVAFGLATVENAEEEPCKIVAIPAGELEEA